MTFSLCDFFSHEKEIVLQKINLEQYIDINKLTIVKAASCVVNQIFGNFKESFSKWKLQCVSLPA